MASGLSDYLEATLLNHVFRATYYTPPDTIYLALLTAVASDSTTGTEVTGGSYARQPITFNAATSGIGKMTSAASVLYTNMPAVTIVGATLLDAVTGGNVLYYVDGFTPRTTASGDNLYIAAGNVAVYLG